MLNVWTFFFKINENNFLLVDPNKRNAEIVFINKATIKWKLLSANFLSGKFLTEISILITYFEFTLQYKFFRISANTVIPLKIRFLVS